VSKSVELYENFAAALPAAQFFEAAKDSLKQHILEISSHAQEVERENEDLTQLWDHEKMINAQLLTKNIALEKELAALTNKRPGSTENENG